MSDQDDEILVRISKRGEEQVFDPIVEKYPIPVYRTCYKYTRNEADARDINQEVLIKVYRNLIKFNERARLFTWIYRITVNTCISFKRGERFALPLSRASGTCRRAARANTNEGSHR
ncbi:MAG: hypothetical protein OEV79_01335 [candidate division WOR-3 bacterium]|nr:hypothetical protein [candidate division WOR-3 bacterium]